MKKLILIVSLFLSACGSTESAPSYKYNVGIEKRELDKQKEVLEVCGASFLGLNETLAPIPNSPFYVPITFIAEGSDNEINCYIEKGNFNFIEPFIEHPLFAK